MDMAEVETYAESSRGMPSGDSSSSATTEHADPFAYLKSRSRDPSVIYTVFDALGDRCEVPDDLAEVCIDIMHRHGMSPGSGMRELTVLFDKLCCIGAAKEYYSAERTYRVAINVVCDIISTRASMGDDDFCKWVMGYIKAFDRFDAEEREIVNRCIEGINFWESKTLPRIFNLRDYDSAELACIEHPDMPLVAVFADLRSSATRGDIVDVLEHLEKLTGFRIPQMYVEVVTNIYDQRVMLLKIPR